MVKIDQAVPDQRGKNTSDTLIVYTINRMVKTGPGQVEVWSVFKNISFVDDLEGYLELKLSDFCRQGDKPDEDHPIRLSHRELAEISFSANDYQHDEDESPIPPKFQVTRKRNS